MKTVGYKQSAQASGSAQKVRGFVIDKDSGLPVAGVAVLGTVELEDGRELPVGMLASDAAGYVSFDLREAIQDVSPTHVHVKVVGTDPAEATLSCDGGASGIDLPFLLRVHGETCACKNGGHASSQAGGRADLPAVQSPDALDWRLSPSSFTTSNPVSLGEGACQILVPTEARKLASSIYRFTQVVRRSPPAGLMDKTHGSRGEQSELEPALAGLLTVSESGAQLAGAAVPRLPPPPPGGTRTGPGTPPPGTSDGSEKVEEIAVDASQSIEFGQVLNFSQTWSPLGHSLGKISYSLPLAPCESVDIAVIDWSRSDEAVRTDQATSTENLVHSQRRDRTIDEVVDGALSESQGGWSFQAGLGGAQRGSASGSVPVDGANVALSGSESLVGGLGYGTAQSWGERDLTSSSLQDLHDSIMQSTGVIRQLKSTVVVQSSQQERNYVETRTVTNHNHCHALTIEYHEVLQHLQVDTRYEGRRWALFVPYKLLDFKWQVVLRYRTILEAVLLDSKLALCLDAIVRAHYCQDLYPASPELPKDGTSSLGKTVHQATPVEPTVSRYQLVLGTGDRNTWGRIWVHVGLKNGTWKLLHFKERKQDAGEEIWANTDYIKDITTGEAIGVDPTQIESVKVGWYEADGGDEWLFKGIKIRYQTTDRPGLKEIPLIDEHKTPYMVDFNDSWGQVKEWIGTATIPPPSPTDMPSATPGPAESPVAPAYSKVDDACCEQKLLVHLQANVGYYSRACWLLQDPTERIMMLDALFAHAPAGKNAIDPTPVAVNGNYVAYPFNGVQAPEPAPCPGLAPRSAIACLPTRGLFAETRLSNCTACEQRDITRFWNWNESPCPEKPPDITQITPGPKGQATTVQPVTLPNPVVQVMNAPSEPDPTGLAAALKVLGTPDIFRDMSTQTQISKLLDGLISGAVTLAQAQDMAAKAKAGTATTTGTAASSGATRSVPNEPSASGQVDKLNAITYAADKGLINDKQKHDAAVGVIGGEAAKPPAGQSDDLVWRDVELIHQTSAVNCWATAAAMVASWAKMSSYPIKDNPVPATIEEAAKRFDLDVEPPLSYSIAAFRDILVGKGPLWVSAEQSFKPATAGFHAVVVTGMYSDGAPDGSGTYLYVLDPWDRAPGSPGHPGAHTGTHQTGSRYSISWQEFIQEFETAARVEPGWTWVRLMHAHDTAGRKPEVGASTMPIT